MHSNIMVLSIEARASAKVVGGLSWLESIHGDASVVLEEIQGLAIDGDFQDCVDPVALLCAILEAIDED